MCQGGSSCRLEPPLQEAYRVSLKIPKERREVIIFTRNHRVEGELYLLMDARLSDELNNRIRDFLPITNAEVYSISGDSLLYRADFVTVNKHAIDLVVSKSAFQEGIY